MAGPVLDVAIIGGGIAGLIHLHYARRAGLQVQLLEQAEAVGGLWRVLPAWQDIQIAPVDWTVGDLPIEGPLQPQVLANICSWVTRFGLAGDIRTHCRVIDAHHAAGAWELQTSQGPVRARHLVAATGAHNTPHVPPVERRDGSVRELHASALREPAELSGCRVVVVGGGASALDLLDLCLQHGADRIVWVHRGLRWFIPTHKPKVVAGSIRPVARMQAQGVPVDEQNRIVRADLQGRYRKFGLEALQPAVPIDLRHDQLFPGRATMLAGIDRIERHGGGVAAVERGAVVLIGGPRIDADLLLWATGWRTDLRWLRHPQLSAVTGVNALAARCGCVLRSLDMPDLYLPAVGLEGFGATSWNFAVMARSVMSHIAGRARLDLSTTAHRLNHLEMVHHLARRDPASFGGADADDYVRTIGLGTPDDAPYPMPESAAS